MIRFERFIGRLFLLTLLLLGATACGSVAPTSEPPVLGPTPSRATAILTAPPTATPNSTATPTPTATPQARPTDEPPPTATTRPTATSDLAGIGLSCPATLPSKPDYARYVVSADPWPTPDAVVPPPLFSLADPLPAAGRNSGYPYGSDGSGRYLLHNGLDMADEDDALAGAVGDGRVIIARDDLDEMFGWRCDWYGQLVVIELDERWNDQPVYALYGHVKDIQVSEGQRVMRGEPIAREGAVGVAIVPHLHLEIRVGSNTFGATRNPLLWLQPWSGGGIVSGRLLDPNGHAWQGVTVTLIDRTGEEPFLNTWTYLDDPDHLIRPDPFLAENFVFGPVAAGLYDVHAQIQGIEYRTTIEVVAGEIATVELITEYYRTPTPTTQ